MIRSATLLAKNLFWKHPTTTVLFVTNRCNLDCKMCFYTERQKRDELTTDEIVRLAESLPPQWYIMFTGGEPFLRKDLVDLVLPFYYRGALNLHISTNATLLDRTICGVRQIAEHTKKARLIIVSSIDGTPEIHDQIREMKGSHAATVATIRELLSLKKEFPHLAIVVNITFSAFNQVCWKQTIDFLHDDLKVDAINLGLTRGHTKDSVSKNYNLAEYRQASRYLAEINCRNCLPPFLRSLAHFKELEQFETIYRIARHDPPKHYRCLAGKVFNVITETGDVYPCEMLEQKIGNLRDVDMDFMKLWSGQRMEQVVQFIDKRNCLCTYECAIGPSMAASVRTIPRFVNFLIQRGSNDDKT